MDYKYLINSLYFKFRFILVYVLIGFFAIIFELFIFSVITHYNLFGESKKIISVLFGIFFAFILNFFLNFKVRYSKIVESFFYFAFISLSSFWFFQLNISNHILQLNVKYEASRLITSASFFLIAYIFHKKFSFKDFKKIGLALYLENNLKINKIHNSVKNYPDFIHIDIIDKTFSKNRLVNKISSIKKIKYLWPNHEIQAHIMSKKPSVWLKNLLPFADIIFVHYEIKENIYKLKDTIVNNGKKFGLAITLDTHPKRILNILEHCYSVLILSIEKPGFSGQKFNLKALEYIDYLNTHLTKKRIKICVDGGIDENIIKILNVDEVVSSSSILKNSNPINQILKIKHQN
jgi:pentose-5-phosphate-3-epimerase/putative flippase GtrA